MATPEKKDPRNIRRRKRREAEGKDTQDQDGKPVDFNAKHKSPEWHLEHMTQGEKDAFVLRELSRKTRQWQLYGPIIWVLLRAPGEQLKAADCLDAIQGLMGDRLTPADREIVSNGEERWKSAVRFARIEMLEAGYLDPDAPRGTWRLA